MPVDTKSIPGRRTLRFDTIDQAVAEADRLADADRAGRLTKIGNWTLGQTLGHLGAWADYSYTGAPLSPPWFVKVVVRLAKKRFLHRAMPAGVRIPKVENGTLATDPMSTDDGLAHFRRAYTRIRDEAPTAPHLLFGPLRHDEWIAAQLRHAELHFSFFRAD